jgi:hypothetical protein
VGAQDARHAQHPRVIRDPGSARDPAGGRGCAHEADVTRSDPGHLGRRGPEGSRSRRVRRWARTACSRSSAPEAWASSTGPTTRGFDVTSR